MAESWTIRYEGSYQRAIVLRQMLEQQGVHVELPWKGRKQLERAQQLVREWQVLLEQAELLERHNREERELLQRLDQEPRELHKRHVRELRELNQQHDRERKEMGMPPKGADAEAGPLVSLRRMFGTDFNQVRISLRSTGEAAAIAETVEQFRWAAPDSKVEVQGEPRTADTAPPVSLRQIFGTDVDQVGIRLRGTGPGSTIARTVKKFRWAAPDSKAEIQGAPHIADGDGPVPPQVHSALTPPLPPASARCTATTRAGARCKLEAGPDGLCPFHRSRGPQLQAP